MGIATKAIPTDGISIIAIVTCDDIQMGDITLPAGMHAAMRRQLFQGQTITIKLRPILDGLPNADFPPLGEWEDLPDSATVTAIIQYYNGASWVELSSGDEFDEVASDELTLNTASLQSQGVMNLSLANDSITEDKVQLFRIEATIST